MQQKNIWRIVNQDFSFDLKILHAGFVCDRNHKPQNAPLDRYVLQYLTRGEGTFELNNKIYKIKAGDLFLIPPAMPYTETNSKDNPYNYYCVAFFGANCNNLLIRAGLTPNNPVINANNHEIEKNLKDIFDYCQENSLISLTKANIALFNVFLKLYELKSENHKPLKKSKYLFVEQIQEYIHHHYSENVTTSIIGSALHANRTYLCEVFKQVMQISIKEYLINYRITQAMDLLNRSTVSINKIAEMTGFTDYSNFYRCFKNKTGVSPLHYRHAYNPTPLTPPPEKIETFTKITIKLNYNKNFSSNIQLGENAFSLYKLCA